MGGHGGSHVFFFVRKYSYLICNAYMCIYSEWTPEDVIEKFLKPLSMEDMAKAFIDQQISGAALLALREEHVKELGFRVLGERLLFLEYLSVLKKNKRDLDRSKALWSITTPLWGKQSHHQSLMGCCFQACQRMRCVYVFVCTCACVHIYMHRETFFVFCLLFCTLQFWHCVKCVHTHTQTHTHTHAHTHHALTHTYTHTCTHTHAHTQLCFPCCVGTTEWRVTGQGIRWRRNRAALDCCGDGECDECW